MTRVVVLGAGYAGATAVKRLERRLGDAELTWVSREAHHLVLHEAHRVVRDPGVAEHIAIPIEAIAGSGTAFVPGEVVGLDTADRVVSLADGREVGYDYLVVALGSRTAFYGIPGLREHALTLKSLSDARDIHEAVAGAAGVSEVAQAAGTAEAVGAAGAAEAAETAQAADPATPAAPARVLVGGAGLSGVQTAGEVAAFREEHDASIAVTVLEALGSILPGRDPALQEAVRRLLDAREIAIRTDDPVVEVADGAVHLDSGAALGYDVLVWTGGITGRDCLDGATIENHHNRVETDATFRSSDERVFAVGDTALVEQDGTVAPPTAQAAWGAAEVAADNVRRAIEGRPLRTWTYEDKGTLVSVGEAAVAHDLKGIPVETFGGLPARFMKKAVAARWIASIASRRRALRAWPSL